MLGASSYYSFWGEKKPHKTLRHINTYYILINNSYNTYYYNKFLFKYIFKCFLFAYTGVLCGIDGSHISCLASAVLPDTLLVVQAFIVKMNILVQF